MPKLGNWSGVDPGASRIENEERKAQNANYAREAQRYNVLTAFKANATPALGLG